MSIDYMKPSLSARLPLYATIDDVTKGWVGVVGKGEKYLPKEPKEDDGSYKARLATAIYTDYYNSAVDGITGLIFKKPIKLNDDVNKQLQDDLINANAMGDDFAVVAGQMFNGALRKGIKFALVDMPKGTANNRADEIAQGIKPYITLIDVENVTSWKTQLINGKIVLTQVKIKEFKDKDVADNPYAVEQDTVYRVIELDESGNAYYILYDDEGKEIESDYLNIDFIPLYALNLDDIGFFEANPPLYEVAMLNIRHYQKFTDSSYASHIASVPFYFASGLQTEESKGFVPSPNTFLSASQPDADIKIVSYDGKGIVTNDILMKKLEKRMSELGFAVGTEEKEMTATETNITTHQKQSKLNRYADSLKDTLENILNAMSIMGGYDKNGGGTVEITADILSNPLTAQEFTAIVNAMANGQLSKESGLEMIKTGDIKFREDWDIEAEINRIQEDGLLIADEELS